LLLSGFRSDSDSVDFTYRLEELYGTPSSFDRHSTISELGSVYCFESVRSIIGAFPSQRIREIQANVSLYVPVRQDYGLLYW
jgi:hypothetical protein